MDKLPAMNISAGNSSVDRRSFLERSGYQHLDHGDLRVLIPVVLGVICVLGFTGNVTAIGVLITNARKSKLSLINALILNLMLADGLVLAFAVPFKATAYSRASWTLGLFVCKTCDWFLHSCMAAKSFTMAIMSKACYRYVSNPTKPVSIRLKAILVILLFTWLLACVVSIPQWLFSTLQRESSGMICVQAVPVDAHDFMSVYVKAYPLLAYCMPLSFALLYFWRAFGRCHRRSSKTQNLRTQIRSRKLTLMLFSLMVAMATMWLPQWVSWVWIRHALETWCLPSGPLSHSLRSAPHVLHISCHPLSRSRTLWGVQGRLHWLGAKAHPPQTTSKTHKPGPHTPTAPKVTHPKTRKVSPPASTPAWGERRSKSLRSNRTRVEDSRRAQTNKDGIVLLDVEQFWQERETDPSHLKMILFPGKSGSQGRKTVIKRESLFFYILSTQKNDKTQQIRPLLNLAPSLWLIINDELWFNLIVLCFNSSEQDKTILDMTRVFWNDYYLYCIVKKNDVLYIQIDSNITKVTSVWWCLVRTDPRQWKAVDSSLLPMVLLKIDVEILLLLISAIYSFLLWVFTH